MSEFTEFDFRTPEQKIASNKAKIQELKNRKAQLMAKRDQMKVAANRARLGDASFVQQMYSEDYQQKLQSRADEADKKALAERLLDEIEDLYLGLPKDKEARLKVLAVIKRKTKELKDRYGETYEPDPALVGNSEEWSPDEWEIFKIKNTDRRGNWLDEDSREMYSNRSQQTAADAEAAKQGAETDTAAEREAKRVENLKIANKAIDKALEEVDYTTLKKEGSYTKSVKIGKEFYDVVVNSNGTATCNGVKREW